MRKHTKLTTAEAGGILRHYFLLKKSEYCVVLRISSYFFVVVS